MNCANCGDKAPFLLFGSLPVCADCTTKWWKSPEGRRLEHADLEARKSAVDDWIRRLRAEQMNGQGGK